MKETIKVQMAPQTLKLNILHAMDKEDYSGQEVFSLMYDMKNNGEISKETFKEVGKWLIDRIVEKE